MSVSELDLASSVQERFRKAHATNLWVSVGAALADHAAILLGAIGVGWVFQHTSPWVIFLLAPVGWLWIARFQRALECLVHEGSHCNWHRGDRALNDRLTQLLAALPTVSSVAEFRHRHFLHHRHFGTDQDPEKDRFFDLHWDRLSRSHWYRLLPAVAWRLARYEVSWWRAKAASLQTVLAALVWHGVVWIVPASLGLGVADGLRFWGIGWAIPFFLVLPVLRFLAEASRHDYEESDVLGSTVSNIGRIHRLVFHPHHDGFHVLHHLDPKIPHHALPRAYELLLQESPEISARARERTVLLMNPEPLASSSAGADKDARSRQ